MNTETQTQMINGVNLDQLQENMDAIQQQPSLAEFQFRSKGRWLDGSHNRTVIDGYYGVGQEHSRQEPFVLDKDEPPVLLGKDIAANPMEYVLAALTGCMTTSLVYQAAAHGVEVEAIETEMEGDLDLRGFLGLSQDVRKGFEGVRVKFKVKSDADEAQIQQFLSMSPVLDIMTNPVPVSVEVEKV